MIASSFQTKVPAGFFPSTSPTTSSPVAMKVVVSCHAFVVPVFSSTTLSLIAPCSPTVHRLPGTAHYAFACHPIVGQIAFLSVIALPLQQSFVVGPGYSPEPFKVVSRLTL